VILNSRLPTQQLRRWRSSTRLTPSRASSWSQLMRSQWRDSLDSRETLMELHHQMLEERSISWANPPIWNREPPPKLSSERNSSDTSRIPRRRRWSSKVEIIRSLTFWLETHSKRFTRADQEAEIQLSGRTTLRPPTCRIPQPSQKTSSSSAR